MKIIIPYESKWSVSLMDNTKKKFKERSKFQSLEILKKETNKDNDVDKSIDSLDTYETVMLKLNKSYGNFDYRTISQSTVLGIVARLMGEVRHMTEALKDEDHIINQLKDKISFRLQERKLYNEIMTLHTPVKDSKSNGQGVITKNKDSLFLSENYFSKIVYSILNIKEIKHLEEIINMLYINENIENIFLYLEKNNLMENTFLLDKFVKNYYSFQEKFDFLNKNHYKKNKNKEYDIELEIKYKDFFKKLEFINLSTDKDFFFEMIEKQDKNVEKGRELSGIIVYTIANWLMKKKEYESEIKNKVFTKFDKQENRYSIAGISSLHADTSGTLTAKDFYNIFAEKKTTNSSPYIFSIEFLKKTGEKNTFNTKNKLGVGKEDGVLEINIDVTREEAIALKEQIEDAAVSTFQMGKKGLAYIKRIEL